MGESRKQLDILVLAAGKGTRMKSEIPKVLHRICGSTLLERTVRAAAELKPRRIVVVIGYGREMVQEELDRLAARPELSGTEIVSAYQAEQLGTGHAAQIGLDMAAKAGPVLIIPGDTPLISGAVLEKLFDGAPEGAEAVVLSCRHPEPSGFGRVVRDSGGRVAGIVEEKDCTDQEREIQEINTSFYLCSAEFLKEALSQLKSDNAQGEYYLTDIVAYGVSQDRNVHAVVTEDAASVSGANSRAEMSELEKTRREQINRAHMEGGVTLEDPAATYIDEGVSIGADTVIGSGCHLKGRTVIGSNVVIEPNCWLEDSSIEDGAHLKMSCYLTGASVGAFCQVGPFAQLRPGTELAESVKIGNFVEVKKAKFGEGAKANHLAYIGDAQVGAGSNIGAGTIFCNYDGQKKSVSVLEPGVFVGSNSTMVSPVHIGEGAYIGAGSVITRDVPGGSLAIGRSRQSNKEGWVVRKKKKQ